MTRQETVTSQETVPTSAVAPGCCLVPGVRRLEVTSAGAGITFDNPMASPARAFHQRRPAFVIATWAILALALSGCGSSSSSSTTTTGPIYEVTTGKVSGLGTVLVDGQGFTVYLYEPDAQSGKSRCSGPCAVEWSPLTLPSGVSLPRAGAGIDPSKLSTFKRSDGSIQVTYNGWPLYTWAEDTAPGQATGEGLDNLGGLWFVLSPAGNAIKKIGAGSI